MRQQRVVREERDSKAEVRQQVRQQGAVSKRVNRLIKPKPNRNMEIEINTVNRSRRETKRGEMVTRKC